METKPSLGFRIDERVFSIMALIALIALVLLGLSFTHKAGPGEVKLTRSASGYTEGSAIHFKAETVNGKNFEWDFGDDSEIDHSVYTATHIYKGAGKYLVKVTVNGNGEGVDTVEIGKAQMVASPALAPIIIVPDSAIINKPVIFKDISPDATSWKWRFFDDGIVSEDTGRAAYYTYKSEGIKKVFLMINDRPDRVAMTSIYVKGPPSRKQDIQGPVIKPPPPIVIPKIKDIPIGPPLVPPVAPEKKDSEAVKPLMVADIQADGMIDLLEAVVAGKKDIPDFTKYFCEQADIQVTYNEVRMKFSQMVKKLKEFKKVKNIEKPEVQLIKNNTTNCIQSMIVAVDKRGLIKKLTGKKS